jgi:hypothetical protein
MALAFYMDHNVPSSITNGLRVRGVDAITAYEDGAHQLRVPLGVCVDQLEIIAKAGELEDIFGLVIFLPL